VKVHFKLEGGQDLERALLALPKEMSRRVIHRGLRKGGDVIGDEMKVRLDAVTRGGTGETRDSVTTRVATSRTEHTAQVQVGPTKDRNFIGRFLEYGTSKMAARPWATPAFEAKKVEALHVCLTELKKALDRAVRRLAKRRAA
jgi:HK97 gp10 family phage protein